VIVAAKREEVPALIAAADIGVSFILATFSAKASCPTKFGEMLAMGVPVIANAGVGDMAEIIRNTGAGALVEDYDETSLKAAIAVAESAAKDRKAVRAAAARYFALDRGIARYDAIYRAIGRSGDR
jgi:glycosyltransferase involved in cell wall biosynthesis